MFHTFLEFLNYYHYQPGISREKLQDTSGVLLRTEDFADSEETREIDTTSGFNRYKTGLGTADLVAVGGVEQVELLDRSISMESLSGLCQTGG